MAAWIDFHPIATLLIAAFLLTYALIRSLPRTPPPPAAPTTT